MQDGKSRFYEASNLIWFGIKKQTFLASLPVRLDCMSFLAYLQLLSRFLVPFSLSLQIKKSKIEWEKKLPYLSLLRKRASFKRIDIEANWMRFYSKSDCWVINAPSQQSTCIGLSISLTASHKHIHIINKEYCSNLVCGFTSSLAIFFQHLGLQILVVFDA